MNILEFYQKLSYIHFLVVTGHTGTPKEFARKLNVSRSTLYVYIADLNALGIEIKYNSSRGFFQYMGERTIEGIFN